MIIKDKTRDEIDEKYKWDLSKFIYQKMNGLRTMNMLKRMVISI